MCSVSSGSGSRQATDGEPWEGVYSVAAAYPRGPLPVRGASGKDAACGRVRFQAEAARGWAVGPLDGSLQGASSWRGVQANVPCRLATTCILPAKGEVVARLWHKP